MSPHDLLIEPEALESRHSLPGNMRQRIKRAIGDLAEQPRPAHSLALDTADFDLPLGVELRRLRIDRYRVVYAINDREDWVWVLTIRKRPPYGYDDLKDLVGRVG
jgi:mRNA interferase RelE/StbE